MFASERSRSLETRRRTSIHKYLLTGRRSSSSSCPLTTFQLYCVYIYTPFPLRTYHKQGNWGRDAIEWPPPGRPPPPLVYPPPKKKEGCGHSSLSLQNSFAGGNGWREPRPIGHRSKAGPFLLSSSGFFCRFSFFSFFVLFFTLRWKGEEESLFE